VNDCAALDGQSHARCRQAAANRSPRLIEQDKAGIGAFVNCQRLGGVGEAAGHTGQGILWADAFFRHQLDV